MLSRRALAALRVAVAGFDWDDGNGDKCTVHGVGLDEAEQVFADGGVLILPDRRHSGTERRSYAVGRSTAGRFVFVVFTLRKRADRVLIRPISVRYMHRREVDRHAEEIS